MIVNMHCRLTSPQSDPYLHSSFLYPHTNSSSSCSYHDQFQRRRRLEDPVVKYASNYYVTHPGPIVVHSSLSTVYSSSDRQSQEKNIYCDLYNLLERPSPVQSKRKQIFFNYSKRTSSQQMILYRNDREKNKRRVRLFSTRKDKHDQQTRSSNRERFQRVLRNYFCMPMMIFNGSNK